MSSVGGCDKLARNGLGGACHVVVWYRGVGEGRRRGEGGGGASVRLVSMRDVYTAHNLQLARKYMYCVRLVNFCQCLL